jgi:hypothetical protein
MVIKIQMTRFLVPKQKSLDHAPGMAPDDLSSLKQLLLLRMTDLEAEREGICASHRPTRTASTSGSGALCVQKTRD